MPLKLQYRRLPGLDAETRAGVSDLALGLRVIALDDEQSVLDLGRPGTLLPFVEPFMGVRLPSGRSPDDSETTTQADVTGDGYWLAHAGLTLSKFVTPRNAVSLSLSYGHRFARRLELPNGERQTVTPGAELDARVAFFRAFDLFWSASLFVSWRSTATPERDGLEQTDGGTRRVRFGAAGLHYLSYPSWRLQAAVAYDPPLNGFARNVPFAGSSLTLGLQRNFD